MRFFRTSAQVYESARGQLDALFGHPKTAESTMPDGSTVTVETITCIPPADVAPHDAEGRILIGLRTSEQGMQEVAPLIEELIASGDVEEITKAEYLATILP